MNRTLRAVMILAILLSCIGCDQATKSMARKHLAAGQTHSFLHDTFRLQYMENTGSFLGMGKSLPGHIRFTVFILMAAGLLLAGLGYVLLSTDKDPGRITAVCLILGGGISNLTDRILHDGRVIDFLNVGLHTFRTGIFNVADMCIMAGIGLLLFCQLNRRRERA